MSISDPSGFRRQLSYDETLAHIRKQDADAGKTLLPGMDRQASRFVQSPFFEKLKETVYEDLKSTQLTAQLATQNQANVERVAARTGLPPQVVRHMGPPDPPDRGGGGGGGGSGGGSGDDYETSARPGKFAYRGLSASTDRGDRGDTSGAGEPRRPFFRSRTPPPGRRRDDFMDDQDDQPGPQGGAGAVRVGSSTSGFAGITPQATAQINEIKLQAELARLQQVNDVTERRAMTAENVANMLHQQRMSNPINQGLFVFGNHPPPPPPAPIPVASVNPDSVAAAVKSAMLGEKRSLQELMAHHGKSLKLTVQEAVSQSMSGAAPTPHPQREVASSSTDPVSVPGVPVGHVKEIRKKFEKGKKKAPPPPTAEEIPVPTEQQERKAKRAATLQERPLQYGSVQERTRGVKRDRNAATDLEDIIFYERARDNPSAQLQREATKARREKRRDTLAARSLNFDGPDQFGARKRPASAQLESEKTGST